VNSENILYDKRNAATSEPKLDPQRTAVIVIHLQEGAPADAPQRRESFPSREDSAQQGVVTRYPTDPQTIAGRQEKAMKRREEGDERPHQQRPDSQRWRSQRTVGNLRPASASAVHPPKTCAQTSHGDGRPLPRLTNVRRQTLQTFPRDLEPVNERSVPHGYCTRRWLPTAGARSASAVLRGTYLLAFQLNTGMSSSSSCQRPTMPK